MSSGVTNLAVIGGTLAVSYAVLTPSEGSKDVWVNLLHLGSFSFLFGIQIWNSIIAGVVLRKTVPSHMFGQAQSGLLPVYFMFGVILSCTNLATFLMKYPYDKLSQENVIQVGAMAVVIVCMMLNALWLGPANITDMFEMYKIEKKYGLGAQIGLQTTDALKADPEYKAIRSKFMRVHGISALVNLVSIAASVLHMYYLASKEINV